MFDLAFDFANVHDDIYFNPNCQLPIPSKCCTESVFLSTSVFRKNLRIWRRCFGYFVLSTSNLRFWYLLGLGSNSKYSNKQIPCESQCWFYAASRASYGSATIEVVRAQYASIYAFLYFSSHYLYKFTLKNHTEDDDDSNFLFSFLCRA